MTDNRNFSPYKSSQLYTGDHGIYVHKNGNSTYPVLVH